MPNVPEKLGDIFPCWAQLTQEQRAQLEAQSEERCFLKGQMLHQGGSDCSGLFLVRDGQLRVYILSQGGREITLYRLFAWDICLFSASCIMKNIRFDLQVQAQKDTQVFIVPADLYESLAKTSLPVSDYTNQLMSSRFSDVMWIMEQTLFSSFDSRLASFLLEQSEVESSAMLTITHDEIARHLGSAREVVTRMLKYFAAEEAVALSRGKITLTDSLKLEGMIASG